MLVSEIINDDVVSVRKEDSVKTAVVKMVLNHCASVSVVDDDHNLIGIVTTRDIMMPLYPQQGDYVHDSLASRDFEAMEDGYSKILSRKVGDIMTANPVSVSVSDPILKALSFMGLRNLRRIPVVDQKKLVGVVTIETINAAMFLKSK